MLRCSRCDATSIRGNYSNTQFKASRTFYPVSDKPWLDICSDCQSYEPAGKQEGIEAGWIDPEVPTVEEDWDS